MAVTATFTDYTTHDSGAGSTGADEQEDQVYWTLGKLKKSYLAYLGTKREEINEQKDARRYRHASQWTSAQIAVLNKRKQPVVTYNRIGRKIDGIVGLLEKLRQDPKAYPRTPQHEQGAELATAALRYCLDEQDWKAKAPNAAEDGAVDGLGGIVINLTQGDRGDVEIEFDVVEPDSFFYDPRSIRLDFTDARFMGEGKWLDIDTATELFPEKAEELRASIENGADLSSNPDRENKWFASDDDVRRVRVVDEWYKHNGKWCWCIYTGSMKLMEGTSYINDEKGKTTCKYIMFSAAVDHDGDRYGFVRNFKSAQDEINQRRSKGLHELNVRRIIAERGAFDDVEKARVEAARPDGVVERNPGFQAEFDDAARIANIEGQLKFLEEAKNEIENYGPNPALIGNLEHSSGRAINLLQQAGIAELGPYILAYRGWKIRVYRALWNAIQQHWTGERWIRVTDDNGLAQFVSINKLEIDPQTGLPTIVNAVGSLDVDIIMDEGPDQINMMADVYENLTALAQSGKDVPLELLIEASALPVAIKQKWLKRLGQPDPVQEQAKQVALAGEAAKVKETESKSLLNLAKARSEGMPGAPMQAPEAEVPIEVQTMETLAKVKEIIASAELKRQQAAKAGMETAMLPMKTMHEQHMAEQSHMASMQNAEADREMQMKAMRAKNAQRIGSPA